MRDLTAVFAFGLTISAIAPALGLIILFQIDRRRERLARELDALPESIERLKIASQALRNIADSEVLAGFCNKGPARILASRAIEEMEAVQ